MKKKDKLAELQDFNAFVKAELPDVYKALKNNYRRVRHAEGIAIAKREGKYKGRKPVEIEDSKFKAEYSRYINREINKTELAKALKVSKPTLDKYLKEKM